MDEMTQTKPLPELLAPAGGLRQLAAAVAAGADAVYLGLGTLNARVSAAGFSWAELKRGCTLAHNHGTRVYGALNIFLFDREFEAAFSLVKKALACGVDAFIVADLGLIDALNKAFPGIEIHLSTQAGVHAPEGLILMQRELGVSRVCTGRELSVSEIADLCQTGVAIETFVHGAICISYSGECSFSALRRGRSAMRGDCTQPCRASYDLVDAQGKSVNNTEGDKLLCPHDFLGIAHLEELCAAGVYALKIEGRIKNPDYVYNVVSVYREALDCIAAGKPVDVPTLTERLKHSFNRGFTDIYLRGAKAGAELMSFERSINQGVHVGRVRERDRQKLFVELCADVHAGDTLEVRFYPAGGATEQTPKRWPMIVCPVDGAAGQTIFVHCKRKVEVGSEVYLTRDTNLLARAEAAVEAALNEVGKQEPEPELAQDQDFTRAEELVENQEGSWPDADAVLLDEMLRTNNRPEVLAHIQAAEEAGQEVVCRNISEVELCRQQGVRFSVAKPIFCSNSHTEALLKSWGAEHIYRADPTGQLMVMDHCVLSAMGPCNENCSSCKRRMGEHYLIEQDGGRVKVEVDHHGRTRLFAT